MSVSVHIWVRRTLDWRDDALVAEQLVPEVRPFVEVWNATFAMRYNVFRQRMKDVAALSLSRVEGAQITARFEDIPDGAMLVPVDDDDWFAPDLAHRLLNAYDTEARGYSWNRELIEPQSRLLGLRRTVARWRERPTKYTCKTNSYALRKDPGVQPFALLHKRAGTYFDTYSREIRRVDGTLGVQVRNPASWSESRRANCEPTAEWFRQLSGRYRQTYAGWRLRSDVRWAQPYLAQVAELMRELQIR
ncbi:MAG: hypothetical protein AB7F99_12220 [Vicinamibacterales bacterium]